MNEEFMCSASIDTLKFSRDFTYLNILMIDFDIDGFLVSHKNRYIQETINNQIETKMTRFYKYAATDLYKDAVDGYLNAIANGFPFNGYGAMQSYTLTYNKNCILSYYMDQYLYTGGAHGTTIRTSQTFSLKNGKILTLNDFFHGDYRKIIFPEIEKQANEKNEQGILFDNYLELIYSTFNPNSFYITDEGLVIYYQQYDIAPYSSGIITFTIPFELMNI